MTDRTNENPGALAGATGADKSKRRPAKNRKEEYRPSRGRVQPPALAGVRARGFNHLRGSL